MANFIPKIIYGTGPTTIQFEYPPEGDNLNRSAKSSIAVSKSTSGVIQAQFNYLEEDYDVNFVFLTQSLRDQLRTFFDTWGGKGKEFKYYESSDEASFITVTLDSFAFQEKRIIRVNTISQDFIYDIKLSFRRTL